MMLVNNMLEVSVEARNCRDKPKRDYMWQLMEVFLLYFFFSLLLCKRDSFYFLFFPYFFSPFFSLFSFSPSSYTFSSYFSLVYSFLLFLIFIFVFHPFNLTSSDFSTHIPAVFFFFFRRDSSCSFFFLSLDFLFFVFVVYSSPFFLITHFNYYLHLSFF